MSGVTNRLMRGQRRQRSFTGLAEIQRRNRSRTGSCGNEPFGSRPDGLFFSKDRKRHSDAILHPCRGAFAAAWATIEPRLTPEDFAAHRRQRAWTAWKYAMHKANLPLSTQLASGRARCFCGVEIDNKGLSDHVAAAHLEMQ